MGTESEGREADITIREGTDEKYFNPLRPSSNKNQKVLVQDITVLQMTFLCFPGLLSASGEH